MADEKKTETSASAKGTAAASKKSSGSMGFIVLMVIFGALVPFIYPTLFLLVGMLPTVVALLTAGNDRQGASVTAVGAMNAAGLTPFVIELWEKGQTVEAAISILRMPETWLVMFGAAVVGQLILFAVPQAITSLTVVRAETRIKLLKDNLETIKAIWGADVASNKLMEKIARGE